MKTFSVSSSIISSSDIADFVCEKYALSPNTTCRLLKAGINHTYRINSDNESFIFRLYSYNWRTKEEIAEELKLLQLLKQNDIAVSSPISDRSENLINDINAPEGLRYAVLFSFAKGNKILNFSEDIHSEIGTLMARIHQQTKGLKLNRITYTPEILLNQSLNYIKPFLSDDTEEMQFLTTTRFILEKELLNANTQLLRTGIVHMDIWFDNLNISNDNKVTLFDFDFCGNGWLCLDIAYYILQLHSTEKDDTERTAKINAFYKGYEKIEKISDEEKRLIPILGVCMYYFYLGVQSNRFENWSNTFLNEVYLKRFIAVLIKGYYEKVT